MNKEIEDMLTEKVTTIVSDAVSDLRFWTELETKPVLQGSLMYPYPSARIEIPLQEGYLSRCSLDKLLDRVQVIHEHLCFCMFILSVLRTSQVLRDETIRIHLTDLKNIHQSYYQGLINEIFREHIKDFVFQVWKGRFLVTYPSTYDESFLSMLEPILNLSSSDGEGIIEIAPYINTSDSYCEFGKVIDETLKRVTL